MITAQRTMTNPNRAGWIVVIFNEKFQYSKKDVLGCAAGMAPFKFSDPAPRPLEPSELASGPLAHHQRLIAATTPFRLAFTGAIWAAWRPGLRRGYGVARARRQGTGGHLSGFLAPEAG
jgi:hypothetical protein